MDHSTQFIKPRRCLSPFGYIIIREWVHVIIRNTAPSAALHPTLALIIMQTSCILGAEKFPRAVHVIADERCRVKAYKNMLVKRPIRCPNYAKGDGGNTQNFEMRCRAGLTSEASRNIGLHCFSSELLCLASCFTGRVN